MSIKRVAIAGTGGLACAIALNIENNTSHYVVLLSRQAQPRLVAEGYQVAVVDYTDRENLKYALRGIDTVISTFSGQNQIELIHAAVEARVRRIAVSEFEGLPQSRPQNHPLHHYKNLAREWLATYAHEVESTAFICGILYERFQPGGLRHSRIGGSSGLDGEGEYIIDVQNMSAQIPAFNTEGQPAVMICMTAMADVALFVTRALDMSPWPTVMTMCGERVNVLELVQTVEILRGQELNHRQDMTVNHIRAGLSAALSQNDNRNAIRMYALLETALGCYNLPWPTTWDALLPDIPPKTFREWFTDTWGHHS